MSEQYGKDVVFRSGSNLELAESILKPDPETGISREVPIEEFERAGLGFGNGGGWVREDGGFCRKYRVEKSRSAFSGVKIAAIQTVGWAEQDSMRSDIPDSVREMLQNQPCPVLGTNVGMSEIDHKDGYGRKGSKLDDFQPLSKSANNAKRAWCKHCRAKQQRFDARRLGFKIGWIAGSSTYTKELGCKGCYWNDVKLFHQQISANA